MPLVATRGAASAQGFGEFAVTSTPTYIEDVFSTWLYTGNSSTQTITNGIDLSTKGGLVWVKWRSGLVGSGAHVLVDTARGANKYISSNTTAGESTQDTVSAFNTTGFNLTGEGGGKTNYSGDLYASWTFREQPKFFDVVTWTGNGSGNRAISHSLTSTPGCIFFKRLDGGADDWSVYHTSLGTSQALRLNTTEAVNIATAVTAVSSSTFTVNSGNSWNYSGLTYVAYLFAHNAGGFGLTGTDNVISCGSFTTDGSGNATVTLGYEPQWVLQKIASGGITSGVDDWKLLDTMRGFTNPSSGDVQLKPNSSSAEQNTSWGVPTATGFTFYGFANATYIYIAIRRGPMKVPTSGTSVFSPIARTGTGATANVTGVGFPPDLVIPTARTVGWQRGWYDRLRGVNQSIASNDTGAELTTADSITAFGQDGATYGAEVSVNASTYTFANWFMRRAPSFYDEVCYTGNSAGANNQNHNLGVVPEMCILKARSGVFAADNWQVVHKNDGVTAVSLALNLTNSTIVTSVMSANFTSTFFKTADATWPFTRTNFNGDTYVAYLFATCAGVSKVGSYTGTGATQTIDCGFGAGGSRFVLIKRTDTTGDWYVWDSARGMISGTDPSLLLNSTAAEVNANSVYAISTGFQIVSTAAGINASAGTYIFLSVA